mmetsp:Transcript_34258/g.85957  ORF Transcript_34258/g.85957 Transcript_34258/m.85957 type:complete len:200 (+) Transcript_34258:139-738(+)
MLPSWSWSMERMMSSSLEPASRETSWPRERRHAPNSRRSRRWSLFLSKWSKHSLNSASCSLDRPLWDCAASSSWSTSSFWRAMVLRESHSLFSDSMVASVLGLSNTPLSTSSRSSASSCSNLALPSGKVSVMFFRSAIWAVASPDSAPMADPFMLVQLTKSLAWSANLARSSSCDFCLSFSAAREPRRRPMRPFTFSHF